MGRRVSWVAPASTSNPTGYPGDLKFLGREEVPRFAVTWTRELERRQKPGRWSPGGWRSCGVRAKF